MDLPKFSPRNKRRSFYVVIPGPDSMTPDEQERMERDGTYPVRVSEYLPSHEDFVQFLLERSLGRWNR